MKSTGKVCKIYEDFFLNKQDKFLLSENNKCKQIFVENKDKFKTIVESDKENIMHLFST